MVTDDLGDLVSTGFWEGGPLEGGCGYCSTLEWSFQKRYLVISVRVNINIDMGVKTITVTEEAYKMLAKEKKEDESFSEVIKRLTKERGKLSDSLGAWKMSDEEAQEIFSSLKRHWKKSTVRIRGNAEHS